MLVSRHLSALCTLISFTLAQTSTTLVTATTTVTATESGACDNFVGACVVYGTDGAAPYTTTVYTANPAQATITATATTTVYLSAGAPVTAASGACSDFNGACVVYASDAQGASYTTTVYGGNSGNNQGLIGGKKGGSGDGFIGGSSALTVGSWTAAVVLLMALLNAGFAVVT